MAKVSPHALPAPISGEAVVATATGPLIIGGLDAASNSAGGVFVLDPASGELSEVGSLTGPLHDAAATVLGNRVLVFGGGTETSSDEVQALAAPGGRVAPGTAAETVGKLPTVRSDLSAVTIGKTAYVLGGYDGATPLASVLATPDGSTFTEVAQLPEPARYLAVATLGGRIYAFGGETGERVRQRRDPGSRPESRNRQGHRPPAGTGFPRQRRRPRRQHLRPRWRRWWLADGADLALRPR